MSECSQFRYETELDVKLYLTRNKNKKFRSDKPYRKCVTCNGYHLVTKKSDKDN